MTDRGSSGADALWSIRIVGTTWLTKGPSYWLRRALFWLMWAVFTAMVTTMAVGVDIGLTRNTGVTAQTAIFSATAVFNLGMLVFLLWRLWPSAQRVHDWATNDRRRGGRARGTGTLLGLAAIGSGPLAAVIIVPMLILGAAGLLAAMLVLSSLPQLPEEAIMRCRRETLSQRYSSGRTTR